MWNTKIGILGGLLVSAALAVATASATSAQTQPAPGPGGMMGGTGTTTGQRFAQTDTDQRLASPAMCSMIPTVHALRECVIHAREIGAIKSASVTRSLLIELDVAQSALDRGRPRVAIALLHAFVREVDALAGKQIIQPHADHLVMHARMVIQALGG